MKFAVAALAVLGALAVGAPVASAEVPIEHFTAMPSSAQAGGHPDVGVTFKVKNGVIQALGGVDVPCDCMNVRDITVHLPAGLIGNPHAAPRCSAVDLTSHRCALDSQVGIVEVGVSSLEATIPFSAAVYNLIPRPGEAGLLGFRVALLGTPQFIIFNGRTDSDYGLDVTTTSIYQGFPIRTFNQVIWGVPADPKNDSLRLPQGYFQATTTLFPAGNLCDENDALSNGDLNPPAGVLPGDGDPRRVVRFCNGASQYQNQTPNPAGVPPRPFLQSPTTCGETLTASIEILSYNRDTTRAEVPWPTTVGCDELTFNPSLAARPTTAEADAPSGVDVELTVPQLQSPSTPSPSSIRATTVRLPAGFSINPNAAAGKTACTDEQARFGTLLEAQCPETAKIGTVMVETAVLPGPLPGAVYLGQPLPSNRYRIFLTADGFNTHVKLPGTITPDPATGQLEVSFNDLPQTPFERFSLHIFGAERGSLATPTQCGTYEVLSTFTPWNNALPDQTSKQHFTIDSGPGGKPCPDGVRPFDPSFDAGSVGNTAGAHTPFAVDLKRPDGDQNLIGLDVKTPPGFSGTLRGIPYCPEASIAQVSNPLYSGLTELSASTCPAASQIGVATAGAGAGSRSLYQDGKVYLAGPYKGAPLSLVVVIPAVSGPYDLGNVAVRAAIKVDPTNAQVTTLSDPLPQIIEGIPLRTRAIRVNLNRPGFTRNPTSCDPRAVEATVSGTEGAVVQRSTHYQIANCAVLPFGPRLRLELRGGTKRAAHPELRATLTANPGEANVARTVVALPKTVLLDNANIRNICTRVRFAADDCPASSVYGHARAFTPQLDQPLEGPVYLRASSNKLPDLVADLKGQLRVELVGRIDTVRGGLRTTFHSVPDASVSRFVLAMQGGPGGLIFNSENICRVRRAATVAMVGQNGKRTSTQASLNPSCGKGKAAKKRRAAISMRKGLR